MQDYGTNHASSQDANRTGLDVKVVGAKTPILDHNNNHCHFDQKDPSSAVKIASLHLWRNVILVDGRFVISQKGHWVHRLRELKLFVAVMVLCDHGVVHVMVPMVFMFFGGLVSMILLIDSVIVGFDFTTFILLNRGLSHPKLVPDKIVKTKCDALSKSKDREHAVLNLGAFFELEHYKSCGYKSRFQEPNRQE